MQTLNTIETVWSDIFFGDFWENAHPIWGTVQGLYSIKFGWNRPETVGRVGFLRFVCKKFDYFAILRRIAKKVHPMSGTIQGSFLLSLNEIGQKL